MEEYPVDAYERKKSGEMVMQYSWIKKELKRIYFTKSNI